VRVLLPSSAAAVVTAISIGFAAAPAQAVCVGEGTSVRTATTTASRAAVICLVNEARAARGLAPFNDDSRLDSAAQSHAADMQAKNYFDHDSQDGRQPQDRISATGYQWIAYGENIAQGYPTPYEVVQGFLGSPEHCTNVLGGFNDIGVGVTSGAYWVQDFGVQLGATPALGGGGCPTSLGRAVLPDANVTGVRGISGSRRGVSFTLACPSGCSASARFRAATGSPALATTTQTLSPGTSRTVRLHATSSGERQLRRTGRRRIRFEVVVSGRYLVAKTVTLPSAH